MWVYILIAALVAFYIVLISPGLFGKRSIKGLEGCYAHRGLHDEVYPENSLGSFKNAVEHGFGIELDVRLSSDGVPYIFHNDTLLEMCGVDKRFDSFTSEELEKFRLCGTDEKIPTLKEALEVIGGKVPLLIEIKSTNTDMAVCRNSESLIGSYKGAYLVQSFNPFVLAWYRRHHRKVPLGLLAGDFIAPGGTPRTPLTFCLATMLFDCVSRHDFLSLYYTHTWTYPAVVTKLFFRPLALWTIRSQAELDRVKNRGKILIFEGFVPETNYHREKGDLT